MPKGKIRQNGKCWKGMGNGPGSQKGVGKSLQRGVQGDLGWVPGSTRDFLAACGLLHQLCIKTVQVSHLRVFSSSNPWNTQITQIAHILIQVILNHDLCRQPLPATQDHNAVCLESILAAALEHKKLGGRRGLPTTTAGTSCCSNLSKLGFGPSLGRKLAKRAQPWSQAEWPVALSVEGPPTTNLPHGSVHPLCSVMGAAILRLMEVARAGENFRL